MMVTLVMLQLKIWIRLRRYNYFLWYANLLWIISFRFLWFSIHSCISSINICLSICWQMYRCVIIVISSTSIVNYRSFLTSFRLIQMLFSIERWLCFIGIYNSETLCFCLRNTMFPIWKHSVSIIYTNEELINYQLIKLQFLLIYSLFLLYSV